MISLLVLVILAWNFYIGYNRGIILQAYYSLACLISLAVAQHYYQELGQKITLWLPYSNPTEDATMAFFKSVNIFELDKVYYAGLAFVAVYSVVYLVLRLLGIFLHFAPIDLLDDVKFNLVSGVLAFFVTLIFLSMIFTVLATVPMPSVQNLLKSSSVVAFLVNHLPIFSNLLENWWVINILK